MKKFKTLFSLFFTFFKISLFTFGGGYAMIAIVQKEMVEKKRLAKEDEFLNIIAIAESTPGPIALNMATFIGYKTAGFLGALFSTFGVILPSFGIVFGISFVFQEFLSLKYVSYAFMGIRSCVAFLILSAGIKMFNGIKKDPLTVILFSITAVLMIVLTFISKNISTVFYVLIGGAIGVMLYLLGLIKKKKLLKNSIKSEENPSNKEDK